MGTNLPSDRRPALEWLEGHIAGWNTNFAAIGLTSAQVIDLTADIASARGSFTSVQDVRSAATAETQSWYSTMDALHLKAADLITVIKSFAATSGSSSAVYLAADMTPRDPASPSAPPDLPGNLTATLQNDGSITVFWDGKGPSGTVYQVYRKLFGETTFTQIGNVGSRIKEYNDGTVPGAIASATYQVRAQHGEKFSAFSSQVTAQFGGTDGVAAAAAA